MTCSQCISFRATELKKIYIPLEDYIEYTPHVTRFAKRLKVQLEPFFYCNNSVETSKISKSVSLSFSEDVDEIISNELQNTATVSTSLVGLISPIRQSMAKVSNTFNSSFPPDCQKASVPIQLQILCSLLIDGCIIGWMHHNTIIRKDNIDLNAIATKVKKHFHGISVTTMQFPLKQNQGVKKNVIYDLSLLDDSKKLALPEDYKIISEPPYRKNTPLSLPVLTINNNKDIA